MGKRIVFAALILLAVLALTALIAMQGFAQADDEQAVLDGKALYYSAWGGSEYSCIYCHANFDEAKLDDGYLRPGHSLWDSAARRSYYNGAYSGAGDTPLTRAVNTCAVGFLKTKPLAASDQRLQNLLAYLRSITPDTNVEPISITRAESIPTLDGDPRRGEMIYNAACILCHREKGSAPALAFKSQSDYVAIKIRGLETPDEAVHEIFGWNTSMPFFSMERLSDQQVADIVSYWEYQQFLLSQPPEIEIETPAEPPAEAAPPEETPPAETAPPEEAPPAELSENAEG